MVLYYRPTNQGKPTQLESQFRLTYTMILNLLCVEELRVEDMMKRSFSESRTRKDAKEYEARLRAVQEEMSQVRELNCYLCHQDLEQYYQTCKQLQGLRLELRVRESFLLVFNPRYARLFH